ncbi:hypothetical protein [Brachybacterium alimentarium]|uniref:hypothetical protein n=1 Tax=Brachybacterium alimentarium TaxID=47845 RepID=UPI000DF11313|nr:hypothetical protein [Brachybacterium alimentarium]RCS81826.1 hypothetical protein CIK67_15630 [Brachybacterium alimentarium]
MNSPAHIHRSTITADSITRGTITGRAVREMTLAPLHRSGFRRRAAAHANTARDIARSAYEDIVGPHQQTHRGDTNA